MSGRVILAESAGFCYGVQRAVDLAQKTAEEQGRCWMLGDLIHNSFVVEDLSQRGIRKTADSSLLGEEDTVVIRSHGELKSVPPQPATDSIITAASVKTSRRLKILLFFIRLPP